MPIAKTLKMKFIFMIYWFSLYMPALIIKTSNEILLMD